MYYIRSESSFDSAHFLKGYAGKCSNLHGHRWRVVVELQAEELIGEGQMRGMVLDFGDLKKFLGGMCDKLAGRPRKTSRGTSTRRLQPRDFRYTA